MDVSQRGMLQGAAVAVRRAMIVPLFAALALLGACDKITNSPHALGAEKTNTFFTAFQERSPKYLDSTASYALDETPYTYSIYEPPYRFHYLKRPYEIAPRTAEAVAQPKFFDKAGKPLADDAPGEEVAEAVYDIRIRKGILYAPHPVFAKGADGKFLYHALQPGELDDKRTPLDFPQKGTRELTAHDYVYAIRRLATTRIKSPSYSTMAEHIVGLKEYSEQVSRVDHELRTGIAPTDRDLPFLDFRKYDMPLRSSWSTFAMCSPYSLRPTMCSAIVEYDGDLMRVVASRRIA